MYTGGLIYAKPMRENCYLTMLDPLYEQYGSVLVFMVYCASLCGDLFWTASILLALGIHLFVNLVFQDNLTLSETSPGFRQACLTVRCVCVCVCVCVSVCLSEFIWTITLWVDFKII